MLTTEFVRLNGNDSQSTALLRAASILQAGGLVVFPTETVYGLGGNGLDENAAKKIYAAKGRPSDNPLIIHLATPEDAEKYAYPSPLYHRLAKAFMPGPLTVILPKRDIVPSSVTGGLDSVAVRCPSHPVAHRLIELAGIPIAAPSANLSGKPSPTAAEHVAQDLSVSLLYGVNVSEASSVGQEGMVVEDRARQDHVFVVGVASPGDGIGGAGGGGGDLLAHGLEILLPQQGGARSRGRGGCKARRENKATACIGDIDGHIFEIGHDRIQDAANILPVHRSL